MYRYQIYGLNITSSREIAVLREVEFKKSDLNVEWHVSDLYTPDRSTAWYPISSTLLDKIKEISLWESDCENISTKVCFRLEDDRDLSFLIDKDRSVIKIYYHPDEPLSDLDSYFVGPVLSFVLRMKGVICLHSSVVAIDGRAVAFLGHATAGKSTTAAGMADAGAEILADDVAVLSRIDGSILVQPGYAKVRLRPKAAKFLTDADTKLPKVYSYRESRYYSLGKRRRFSSKALPLAAIYVLGQVSSDYREPFIEPVLDQFKFVELIKNTSGSYVVDRDSRSEEFGKLADLARRLPMRRLFHAHEIETLPAQCKLITNDFRTL